MSITDEQARDALILHLERSVKENRMLLRDQFAMAALQGLLACSRIHEIPNSEIAGAQKAVSDWAYQHADAMLEARK